MRWLSNKPNSWWQIALFCKIILIYKSIPSQQWKNSSLPFEMPFENAHSNICQIAVFKWTQSYRFQDGRTDLWCADLDPVRFNGVEVLAMYSYYMGVTSKWAWESCEKMEVEKKKKTLVSEVPHPWNHVLTVGWVVPVLRRTVPESSYTVICLPLQIVTESCWYGNTDKAHINFVEAIIML